MGIVTTSTQKSPNVKSFNKKVLFLKIGEDLY